MCINLLVKSYLIHLQKKKKRNLSPKSFKIVSIQIIRGQHKHLCHDTFPLMTIKQRYQVFVWIKMIRNSITLSCLCQVTKQLLSTNISQNMEWDNGYQFIELSTARLLLFQQLSLSRMAFHTCSLPVFITRSPLLYPL